ncbi:MAG: hypothetical protein ACK5LC_17400 [Coprobacillaceae bacterium]
MCHKSGNDTKKDEKKEHKDTGFKNKIIEYDENYLDNSNAQE